VLLQSLLRQVDFFEAEIAELNQEVVKRLRGIEEVLDRLDTIPGVDRRCAEEILAEIGPDMERFPSAGHIASWAKVCPGNN